MRHTGFRLVGDNIDNNIRRRHLRLNTKNQPVHCFHVYAVEIQIDVSSFSDDCTDTVQRKTMVGENFGKFGKSRVICQSFTHPNLHSCIL